MRFIMLAMPKGSESAPSVAAPSAEVVARMMQYHKALERAGVLLALDGLFPPSTGARISYAGGKATVTDSAFAETKEGLGGYWIVQVRSREEAIEWAKRAPMSDHEVLEVRQIREMCDFPKDVWKPAARVDPLTAHTDGDSARPRLTQRADRFLDRFEHRPCGCDPNRDSGLRRHVAVVILKRNGLAQ